MLIGVADADNTQCEYVQVELNKTSNIVPNKTRGKT